MVNVKVRELLRLAWPVSTNRGIIPGGFNIGRRSKIDSLPLVRCMCDGVGSGGHVSAAPVSPTRGADANVKAYSSRVLSRNHVKLLIDTNGAVWATDLESMHGTALERNSRTIKLTPHEPLRLMENDILIFGKIVTSRDGVTHMPLRVRVHYSHAVPPYAEVGDLLRPDFAKSATQISLPPRSPLRGYGIPIMYESENEEDLPRGTVGDHDDDDAMENESVVCMGESINTTPASARDVSPEHDPINVVEDDGDAFSHCLSLPSESVAPLRQTLLSSIVPIDLSEDDEEIDPDYISDEHKSDDECVSGDEDMSNDDCASINEHESDDGNSEQYSAFSDEDCSEAGGNNSDSDWDAHEEEDGEIDPDVVVAATFPMPPFSPTVIASRAEDSNSRPSSPFPPVIPSSVPEEADDDFNLAGQNAALFALIDAEMAGDAAEHDDDASEIGGEDVPDSRPASPYSPRSFVFSPASPAYSVELPSTFQEVDDVAQRAIDIGNAMGIATDNIMMPVEIEEPQFDGVESESESGSDASVNVVWETAPIPSEIVFSLPPSPPASNGVPEVEVVCKTETIQIPTATAPMTPPSPAPKALAPTIDASSSTTAVSTTDAATNTTVSQSESTNPRKRKHEAIEEEESDERTLPDTPPTRLRRIGSFVKGVAVGVGLGATLTFGALYQLGAE